MKDTRYYMSTISILKGKIFNARADEFFSNLTSSNHGADEDNKRYPQLVYARQSLFPADMDSDEKNQCWQAKETLDDKCLAARGVVALRASKLLLHPWFVDVNNHTQVFNGIKPTFNDNQYTKDDSKSKVDKFSRKLSRVKYLLPVEWLSWLGVADRRMNGGVCLFK